MKTFSQTAPTALVTGGSRGIGRATALALARDGYQVILTYVSRPEEAMGVAELINAGNSVATAYQLNVGDAEGVKAFFREKIKDQVNLTCLVNNAGITKDGLLIRMKEEDFDRVIDVNLRGCFLCTREAAKIMIRNRTGCIVNIASVVGLMGNPGQANYCASKAGIIGLTKSSAKELAARNVRVNAVAPGFNDKGPPGGAEKALHGSHSAQTFGPRRGSRRCRCLPRLSQGRLHHRTGAVRQRRHVLLNAIAGYAPLAKNRSIWRTYV